MNFKKVKRMPSDYSRSSYQCCFCGESIGKEALVSMNLDLGDMQLQQLYCHGLCLKGNLHASVPFIAPEEIESE
jgi:hypothetical protein